MPGFGEVAARGLRSARADAVLAGSLLLVGESQVLLGWHDGGVGNVPDGSRVLRALLCVVLVLPLAWRRTRALIVATVIAVAVVLQVLALAYVPFLAGLLPLAVSNYSVAAYGARRRQLGLVLSFVAVAAMFVTIPEERAGGEVLFTLFVILGTWLAGDVVHSRMARAGEAVASAQLEVARQGVSYAEALADERARIARELHDVIAHSVGVMGVQAGAARTLMDTDTEAAREALMAVEETARSSVAELQRLLTMLRGPHDSGDRTPQPGLSELPDLVARMRDAGLPVDLRTEPPQEVGAGLPAGVDLAAYRIVQEALTNALKHAGTPTLVRLTRGAEGLDVEVCGDLTGTPSTGAAGGHGIVGMRERAQLYGGTLHAGPDRQGRFVVRARLPVETAQVRVQS